MPSGRVPDGDRVHRGAELTLVDLGEGVEQAPRRSDHATILGTLVLGWAVFLLWGVIVLTSSWRDGVEGRRLSVFGRGPQP